MVNLRSFMAHSLFSLSLLGACQSTSLEEEGLALQSEDSTRPVVTTQIKNSTLNGLTYAGLLNAVTSLDSVENRATFINIVNERMNQDLYDELMLSPEGVVYRLEDVVPSPEDFSQMSDWVIVASPESSLFTDNIHPDLKPKFSDSLVSNVSLVVVTPYLINSAIADKRTPYLRGTISKADSWAIYMGTSDGALNDLNQFNLTLVHELDHVERFSTEPKDNFPCRLDLETTALQSSVEQLDYALSEGIIDPEMAEVYRKNNLAKSSRAKYLLERNSTYGSLYPQATISPSQILEGMAQSSSEIDKKFLGEEYARLLNENPSGVGEELFWAITYSRQVTSFDDTETLSILCDTYRSLNEDQAFRRWAIRDALSYIEGSYDTEVICDPNYSRSGIVTGGIVLLFSPYIDFPNGDDVQVFRGLDN